MKKTVQTVPSLKKQKQKQKKRQNFQNILNLLMKDAGRLEIYTPEEKHVSKGEKKKKNYKKCKTNYKYFHCNLLFSSLTKQICVKNTEGSMTKNK